MTPTPVLVVTPSLARGGAERHSTWIATTLDASRWQPHVLSFDDGPLRADLLAHGVPVEIRPLPRGARAVPAAAAAIRAAVDRTGAGLVSGHHVLTEAGARLALRQGGPPLIAWKHAYGHVGHRGLRERVFERATGGTTARYGAVCHTQVRYLTDQLGLPADKITVVPNAVPAPAAPPPLPTSGPPVVVMPAVMRPQKDHALVLRAWRSVLDRHPQALLRLLGDGTERRALESLAHDLGISHRVHFAGATDDVAGSLVDAHLVVLASYTVECFPYAALEAMASGRAVVSTDVGGLPEMVDDGVTGRLVPPRDATALAAALSEGLDEATSAAPTWGTAGWERVRTVFPLHDWTRRIDRFFADVVAAGSPSAAPGPTP